MASLINGLTGRSYCTHLWEDRVLLVERATPIVLHVVTAVAVNIYRTAQPKENFA